MFRGRFSPRPTSATPTRVRRGRPCSSTAAPATRLIELRYDQTPASVTDIAGTISSQRTKVLAATWYLPALLLGLGVLALLVGGLRSSFGQVEELVAHLQEGHVRKVGLTLDLELEDPPVPLERLLEVAHLERDVVDPDEPRHPASLSPRRIHNGA